MASDEQALKLLREAMRNARATARGARMMELRQDKRKTYDSRGLHLFSYYWGRLEVLAELLCEGIPTASQVRDEESRLAARAWIDEQMRERE